MLLLLVYRKAIHILNIGSGGLESISKLNIMNTPLVISVLLNSPWL